MRRLLAAVCLGLVLALAAGCGEASPSGAQSQPSSGAAMAQESPVPSQTGETAVRTSFSMPYNSSFGWNPFTCQGMENRAVMELIYEGLFTLNNQFEAEPLLARSVTISDTELVYTIELQDAKFSSGKTLTADDVVYSMGKAESSDLFSARFRDISAYYSSGSSTVTIELDQPNDRLACLLTFPIVPSSSNVDAAPPGTGPFVRSADDSLIVNQDWWQGAGALQFQSVTLVSSASAEDTRDNFEIDNVHLVYNNPSASSAASYHSDYELWNSRGTTMQYLGFNSDYGMFQDKAVRAVITHAIDRVSIAESVYHNFADPAVLPASPYSSLYDEKLAQQYAFTSAKAATSALMQTDTFYLPPAASASPAPSPSQAPEDSEDSEDSEESAGEDASAQEDQGPQYNAITLLVMAGNLRRVTAAQQVAQALTEVGFSVTVQELEQEDFYDTLNSGQWDLFYGEVTLLPDFDLRSLLSSGGELAYGGLGGAGELDYLLSKALENSGNYYDLYESIMENGYLCPVLFINNAVFTARGVFTGLDPSPDCVFHGVTEIALHPKT